MQEKRNITGLTYIDEFEPCPDCLQPMASGPYLYENQNYLPRAFWSNEAILVVGQSDRSLQSAYAIFTDNRFNFQNQVIISGKHDKINDYQLEELKHYKAIILTTNSVDQNSNFVLQRYVDQGGVIFPNILVGEQTGSDEQLTQILQSNATITPLKIKQTPNTITLNLQGLEPGFVIMNERMHLFPGWKVFVDDKLIINGEQERLEKTNLMLSSFYLKQQADKAQFIYSPYSFELGKKITLATFGLCFIYLIWLLVWKRKKSQ